LTSSRRLRAFAVTAAALLALIAGQARATELHEQEFIRAAPPYDAAAKVIRAAKAGNVRAQAVLGWMYANGRGVPQDYFLAAKSYQSAATQGHGGAQFELGLLHNKGQGVPQDNVNAHMWFNLATARFPDSRGRDLAVSNRDVVANKLTPEQLTQAQNLARTWRPK